MQIWRMNANGSDQVQITNGELNDWFPHPSPDGTRMVFLSYPKEVEGHRKTRCSVAPHVSKRWKNHRPR